MAFVIFIIHMKFFRHEKEWFVQAKLTRYFGD